MLETVRCVLLPLLAKCKRRKAGFVRLFRRMQWGGAWQLVGGLSACVRPFRLCEAFPLVWGCVACNLGFLVGDGCLDEIEEQRMRLKYGA